MKSLNKRIINRICVLVSFVFIMIAISGCGLLSSSSNDNTKDEALDLESMESTADITEVVEDKDVVNPEVKGKNLVISLYFPDLENDAIVKEKHELPVYEGAVLKAAVEGLIAGPDGEKLSSPIPAGTKLLGINLKNDLAIVDFSKEFKNSSAVSENFEKIALVNTLTEFESIKKVKVLVEGNEWTSDNGEPFGEMAKIPLDPDGKPAME